MFLFFIFYSIGNSKVINYAKLMIICDNEKKYYRIGAKSRVKDSFMRVILPRVAQSAAFTRSA